MDHMRFPRRQCCNRPQKVSYTAHDFESDLIRHPLPKASSKSHKCILVACRKRQPELAALSVVGSRPDPHFSLKGDLVLQAVNAEASNRLAWKKLPDSRSNHFRNLACAISPNVACHARIAHPIGKSQSVIDGKVLPDEVPDQARYSAGSTSLIVPPYG